MSELAQTNLTIKRGDSKTYTLKFADEDNSPIDITGWTVFFTMKANIDDVDNDAKIKKDITTHTDPTNGETEISLSATDTAQDIGSYVFDIQIKKSTGEIKTILEGIINVGKDVTQRTS